jgi:hypothetical protein
MNEYQEYFLGGKGGQCLGQTSLPPSRANCLEIWKPQPPGTLRAHPGLYTDCFTVFHELLGHNKQIFCQPLCIIPYISIFLNSKHAIFFTIVNKILMQPTHTHTHTKEFMIMWSTREKSWMTWFKHFLKSLSTLWELQFSRYVLQGSLFWITC